mmetsp:Transcript_35037/g.82005  ORF Transcript_35037/g.82005 Transcript_35037/m.82005 type:complete len:103 (-) Transcript_35037:643-951(-)
MCAVTFYPSLPATKTFRPPLMDARRACICCACSDWRSTKFVSEVTRDEPTVYYDSVSGKPLFVAPVGRSMDDFLRESASHGWPSFRDQEESTLPHTFASFMS